LSKKKGKPAAWLQLGIPGAGERAKLKKKGQGGGIRWQKEKNGPKMGRRGAKLPMGNTVQTGFGRFLCLRHESINFQVGRTKSFVTSIQKTGIKRTPKVPIRKPPSLANFPGHSEGETLRKGKPKTGNLVQNEGRAKRD